jgi:hypothetical protein
MGYSRAAARKGETYREVGHSWNARVTEELTERNSAGDEIDKIVFVSVYREIPRQGETPELPQETSQLSKTAFSWHPPI